MEKVAARGEMPKPTTGRDFYIATADEIRAGRTSDIYFARTLDVLKKAGRSRANVVAEVTTGARPHGWPWGIFCGLEEVVHRLTGEDARLWALPEGSLFPSKTPRGIPLPVLTLEGPYEEWALYETPVLGMICQASGIATKAARIRKLANGKQVLSFGVRRMHPGIAPLIERSVTIGGLDAITTPLGADLLGVPAMGTMPHALVIVMGGPREAFAAVHKYLDVKIFVSGSVDEKSIPALLEAGVDGFGVGTSLSNAPTIDFALDLVEVDGKPAAKRSKFGGRKDLQRCPKDGTYEVGVRTCPVCGTKMAPAYTQHLDHGRVTTPLPALDAIRERAMRETERASLEV